MKLAVKKQTTALQTTYHKIAFGAYCSEPPASSHDAATESESGKGCTSSLFGKAQVQHSDKVLVLPWYSTKGKPQRFSKPGAVNQSRWLMSRNASPKAGRWPPWEGQVGSGLPKTSCMKSPRARENLATFLGPTFKARKKNSSLNAKHNGESEEWKMQGDFHPHQPQLWLREFAEKLITLTRCLDKLGYPLLSAWVN